MATISMDDAQRIIDTLSNPHKNHIIVYATNRVKITLLKSIVFWDMVLKTSGIEVQLWGIDEWAIKDGELWLYTHDNAPFHIAIKD